ncbi:MAG TPA: glycosyl hydrolase 53 family protein [Bacteroidales bacterium]|nr:glycosyl hydrolase 53 family protein [Bacteroidales bacterium]
MRRVLFCVLILMLIFSCSKETHPPDHVVRGADMSFLPELRTSGYVLKDTEGKAEDPLLTLKKAGVNTIRLRIWHRANHPVSSPAVVASMASQCRKAGFRVMISMHYSDTWADPGSQLKPAAWQNLGFDALRDSVYDFTYRITKAIKPDYIQIGNEINGGLLWPDGSISNAGAFRQLLQAGIQAARSAHPQTKIVLHYAGIQGAEAFFSSLGQMDYDVAGLSYYPYWHGTDLAAVQQTLINLRNNTGRETMIVELAYPFSLAWNDQTHNVIGRPDQLLPGYPASSAGQRDFVCRMRQLVNDAGASGFCYWGAEWVSYKGPTATDGSSWENQALWDFSGNALPALQCFGLKN